MADVNFTQVMPWALLPRQHKIDRRSAREERDLYQQHFRYKRVARLPADCPPWVMGQELGWVICSPVTLIMTTINDIDFGLPQGEELSAVGRKIDRSELWHRQESWIATKDTDWLRFHDFATPNGWEGMFLPNGAGSVEWRMGWSIAIPDHYFLMVLGIGVDGLDVPLGVIPAKAANRDAGFGGFSIAVRPVRTVKVHRGDPVARIVLLHSDSLQARVKDNHGDDAR